MGRISPLLLRRMSSTRFVATDSIRDSFSKAMSAMYQREVPMYGTLLDLVRDVNQESLKRSAALPPDEVPRLSVERHGAIRLGTARELSTMRRLFAVMGMRAVGYYDLSIAQVPVHSTAFRPVSPAALLKNPFRVFTSLLRMELIPDAALRAEAERILARRDIFTPKLKALLDTFEAHGGLTEAQSAEFVVEALETFKWHRSATVDEPTYKRLLGAHRLIADVVCFRGPHINHLTPRTLDIDAVQQLMPQRGISPKETIEGPPPRKHPILLRQTSFKALEEPIQFLAQSATSESADCTSEHMGTHTARFGEVEQRGAALTREGRRLYDELLAAARKDKVNAPYERALQTAFAAFPDTLEEMRARKIAYFRYTVKDKSRAGMIRGKASIDDLVASGAVAATPMVYEDFLPVSAAGIFQSNLGKTNEETFTANANKGAFEEALGDSVQDEFALYESMQQESIDQCFAVLNGE